jgi:crotonobetainyl-CoA:carnitine CoA-transferase CaiB-like acyl-CoA transferase
MTRPFEGIKVIDITHVLAGPFAAYQLALLGADVIKVEQPDDPDQSRGTGSDRALNRRLMGTGFLTQASNKRSITLDLKTERGREILKKLVATADVMVENYRPGAFKSLGLGYEDMLKVNPRLIYASMTAFGQDGPRGTMTAYDHVIQSTSGIMAATGTKEVNPLKIGAPAIDYATGTTGAFALAAALFQRERTGTGQYIDMAMLDVALMLQASHVTGFLRTGKDPKPPGNAHLFASNSCYETQDGLLMLGASNRRQHKRIWAALGRPELGDKDNEYREDHRAEEAAILRDILMTKTAAAWEEFFQARHVPASRVRPLAQALADPHLAHRGVLHRAEGAPGVDGAFTVPMMAFKLAHGGARVDSPPPELGAHTDEVLRSLGYGDKEIAAFREEKVV